MELVDDQENLVRVIQPHCQIVIKCTREIAGFNGLSDAFKRLDFRLANINEKNKMTSFQ